MSKLSSTSFLSLLPTLHLHLAALLQRLDPLLTILCHFTSPSPISALIAFQDFVHLRYDLADFQVEKVVLLIGVQYVLTFGCQQRVPDHLCLVTQQLCCSWGTLVSLVEFEELDVVE